MCSISSCYKESENFRCVREPLFDFKNECKNLKDIDIYKRINPETYVGDKLKTPTYSPVNTDLIAYIKQGRKLVIYNKETKQEVFESTELGLITGKPDWSENNVICVTTYQSEQVHFLDVDAMQFESVRLGNIKGVEWFNSAEIIYFQHEGRLGHYVLKYDYYDKILDTVLDDAGEILSSSNGYNRKNNQKFSKSKLNYNYFEHQSQMLDELWGSLDIKTEFIVWHPIHPRIYYTRENGLFYYDYDREKEIRVKKNCDSWYYISFDFTPDGNKIIAELHQKWVDEIPEPLKPNATKEGGRLKDDWYYINSHIVEFDLDGCNEKVIIEGEME